MKLKKTLSVLIGGICLAAATTVALAMPKVNDTCHRKIGGSECGLQVDTYYYGSSYTKIYSHKHNGKYCTVTQQISPLAVKCPRGHLNYTFDWVRSEKHSVISK